MAKSQKSGKRKAAAGKRTSGRIQVRADTAPYRAVVSEQTSRVREEIDSALADARRVREEIEARMATQWHNKATAPAPVTPSTGRRSKA